MRQFLLYCPTYGGRHAGNFFAANRVYDVALHDYSGSVYTAQQDAEYRFSGEFHKWPAISQNLRRLPATYDYYAFLDDDIDASADDINRLFLEGTKSGFELFQATLTWRSHAIHRFHYRRPYVYAPYRNVPLVELMMPVFSRATLVKCRYSFNLVEGGYGIDNLWCQHVRPDKLGVLDNVVFGHYRPISSTGWIMSSGLTSLAEMEIFMRKYNLTHRGESCFRDRLWSYLVRILKFIYFKSPE